MMILENKLESLKLLENKLESMMIVENKLELLKLQENQPWHSSISETEIRERAEGPERAESKAEVFLLYSYEYVFKHIIGLLVQMSADVAWGHGGDGGGDDRPPPYQVPTGCGGKGTRKPNLGGRRAGRLHTRQETQNPGLKAITDKSGPVPIRFEVDDRETLMPLGDHAAQWANYLGELVKELPLHYPSWRQMPPERKAGVVTNIETQFDLRPHMESDRWPQIYAGIQQHLQKIYNGKKAALKERYWVPEEDGTYDLERIRRGRPSYISEVDWDAQLAFWNDPKNLARAAQNKQNRAKSKVVCRQGSRSIAALRDMHMETSATREYPSLIHTFFLTHTVGGVFLNPEDKALYGLGSNTPTRCMPYTEDEIMAIVRGGKQRGHIPGVGRVLPGQGTVIPPPSQSTHSTDIARLKKREKQLTKQVNMFMRLFRSDDKFSQMLNQFESQPEYGGGSGSGGCGDDEPGDDEDGGEDEDDS
ncbi:RNA-directed DNA polymerase, eukaryota [Tanacetum coccineum]